MIEVVQTSPAVGAEIRGVDLAVGLSDDDFAIVHQAFVDHGVVFFRDQEITPDQHVAFAERWGQININRFFQPVPTHPQVAQVLKEPDQKTNIGANWHTDHTYDQIPAMCSILYAREVPPVGGDTLFASQCAAYDALSDGMKQTLLGLQAEHSSRHAFGAGGAQSAPSPKNESAAPRIGNPELANQDALHPVIIKHPLSGRPALYVNTDFTLRFHGWSDEESAPLLQWLYVHATRPEFTTRFVWQEGSIAMWDNRATQHIAVNDYHGHRRLMHRITIEGEALHAASPALL